ncbi:hypothetical protein HanPSC8_Chr05g0214031 [Helianthus annuus]|nr:hypothetical protein HanPSC8_Chr05g0214031 [Helianthus annuus]
MYFKMLHLFKRTSYSIIYFHITRTHKILSFYHKHLFPDIRSFTKCYSST